MTDIKAAAERLRRIKAGDKPASVYAESLARLKANHDRRNDEMKLRAYFDEREIIRELVTNDESELSDAYLAERPADGETEIDGEWFASLGWEFHSMLLEYLHPNRKVGLTYGAHITDSRHGRSGLYLLMREGVHYLDHIKTRQDVRDLCRVLGVSLKEGA